MLTNEKYIGNNVFAKVSFKLKQRRVVNPRKMWIRAEGAYPAIVDQALFLRAREIVDARSRHFSDEELLEALRTILNRQGMLSGLIIDEQDDLPSSSAYRSRFGSLLRAYRLIGYEPDRDYSYIEVNRALRQAHPQVVAEIIAGVTRHGGSAVQNPETDMLRVNDEFTLSIVLARCTATAAGSLRWRIRGIMALAWPLLMLVAIVSPMGTMAVLTHRCLLLLIHEVNMREMMHQTRNLCVEIFSLFFTHFLYFLTLKPPLYTQYIYT